MRSLLNTTKSRPHSLQLEKAHASSEDPVLLGLDPVKNKLKKKKIKGGVWVWILPESLSVSQRSKSTYNKKCLPKIRARIESGYK